MAPIGNGLLYVRKEMIPKFWPLQAAPERQNNDIRTFEAIGAERKAARFRYLTLRWVNALKVHPRIKILSAVGEPAEIWAVAAVAIEGIDVRALNKFLFDKYRIVSVALVGGAPPNSRFDYQALRISPNIYTTTEEIDTFVAAMEEAMKSGVPGAPEPTPEESMQEGQD